MDKNKKKLEEMEEKSKRNQEELFAKISKAARIHLECKEYALCPTIYSAENLIPTEAAVISFKADENTFTGMRSPDDLWIRTGHIKNTKLGRITHQVYTSQNQAFKDELCRLGKERDKLSYKEMIMGIGEAQASEIENLLQREEVKRIKNELEDLSAVILHFLNEGYNANKRVFSKAFISLFNVETTEGKEWPNYYFDKTALVKIMVDKLGLRKNGRIDVKEAIKYIEKEGKKDVIVPNWSLYPGFTAIHDYLNDRIEKESYEKELKDNGKDIGLIRTEMYMFKILASRMMEIGCPEDSVEIIGRAVSQLRKLRKKGLIEDKDAYERLNRYLTGEMKDLKKMAADYDPQRPPCVSPYYVSI